MEYLCVTLCTQNNTDVSHVQNNMESGYVGHVSCVIPSGENNVAPLQEKYLWER